ncbi:LacI family DNA-binding transcriptional regulator [Cellulomonas hominis]|uniref:LacI family DNA-binding transcriptional regulator n=1 Tax=Cellulomonas hominis TaxID=156981 RepID=UPI001B92072B|nr:LacI family DNA-binding transcriptional regulator [Cellulomonas hominis]VTR77991.1 HTH-type transcriptional regulator DegA [Cellulomonas hominis]
MAGQVTLSDVAREAGVSLATASRALNGSANRTVGADLRQRVLAAAARLRYSPDGIAQAMARGRTTSLGLVVHDIADPYFGAIAAGVAAAADEAGLMVTLASTGRDPQREIETVGLLERQRARAVILAGGRTGDPGADDALRAALDSFRGIGGSVAVIGQAALGSSTVAVGNREGASDLVRALHGRGYRRFAVLAGPGAHATAADRRDGFLEELAALGCPVPPDRVLPSPLSRDGAYEAMRRLLADRGDVEVVLALNDVMAVGALAAARDAGVDVPGDLAVAGFDGIETLRDVTPALTTVRLPLEQIGAEAVRLVLAPPADDPVVVPVLGAVELRDSTPGLPRR